MHGPRAVSLKQKRYVLELEHYRDQAPHNIEAHARLIHRDDRGNPIIAQRHHQEWASILEDVEKHRWVCIVAPPGYAKTTWCSVIYPTWRIGSTGGEIRLGLISRTANQARALSMAIQSSLQHPWFQKCYPGVAPDEARQWARNSFYVQGAPEGPNPTLLAAGIGSREVQGKRFDEIVMDDPVNLEDVRSEQTMEGIRHWFKTMLLERFPPGYGPPDGEGRMVVVLTRWGERDLVPTFEDHGFKIITMPALGYWDRSYDDNGNVLWGRAPLWPEKESLEALEAYRNEDELTFELVMQGNPRVLSGDIFNPSNFQRGPMPSIDSFDQVVQYADTASGKDRSKGDYFALATVGIRGGGEEVWILDMVRGRWPAPEQERIIKREYERWSYESDGKFPNLVVIEDANEGIALYQRLVVSTRLPLNKFSPTKDKETRAIPLANAYRARRVWHPEGAGWVRAYEQELAAFGSNQAHDDQVDAAGGAYTHTERPGPRVRMLR